MKRYHLTAVVILLFACTRDNKSQGDKFRCDDRAFDNHIFTPLLINEGETGDYGRTDTLRAGEYFKAKLFRQFRNMPDSNGADMIREFKGYYFRILMKEDLDPAYVKSWTKMNRYITEINDTAYINIPVDSVIKYSDEKIRWDAGYRCIFHKDSCDISYTISGTWLLVNSNAR